ncbi:Tim44-like domain [Hoeflea sp. IMCC20628]|uniref:TIM44-like domain-containing protein n=1 Tax=Hoeflea sp. IMCC20628 TaxID=1620421 RepID=UPI00063ADD11|nr:TIM44-like domain-containing protein [Hoeflea sp. IMCC20628]AKH98789.1 Tim44-like domain [Hoeflea sp. IMCC20628]
MNEAAENGSSLWPMITFGIYWAYLIATYEKRRRKGLKTFFDLVLSPHEPGAAHDQNSNWFTILSNRQNDLDDDNFLTGAVKTYEFILTNYAAGKTAELVGLLSPDVFEVFSNHIEDRATRGERLSLDIVTLSDARIVAKDSAIP